MAKNGVPSKKKIPFPINEDLRFYLAQTGRLADLPIQYEDLHRFQMSQSLLDSQGNDTLWLTVYYSPTESEEIHSALTKIYALLKTDGDNSVIEHLEVARIDFCTFGNSRPYRIRIINKLNDNYDHFYVKQADASRIYGLELEHILSPNKLTYLVHEDTLIEEHVAGIPGDSFIANDLDTDTFNQIRIAKEFVKFNERCFVRLLGDMRAYNYVVDITPDIEGNQYRIRAIDFDQQSYEGGKSFYLPQYFKENNPIIFLGMKYIKPKTMMQYQIEERSLIGVRAKTQKDQFNHLMQVMTRDSISSPEKVQKLKKELGRHHDTNIFSNCQNMGQIVLANIRLLLSKEFHGFMNL